MDEYTVIAVLIAVLLLMVFLLLFLVEMIFSYWAKLVKLQEENKRLRQLIQEGFLLDNGAMAAFNKMFSAACLHGFGENTVDEDI